MPDRQRPYTVKELKQKIVTENGIHTPMTYLRPTCPVIQVPTFYAGGPCKEKNLDTVRCP